MTKFKVGDKVKIVFHPNEELLGKIGTVTEVIDRNDVVMSDNASMTSGFYKVKVDGHEISDYAEDDCIELVTEGSK